MLCSIASVAEGFAAAWILAGVRFLAGMRPKMSLEVLQSRVGLEATFELYSRRYLINSVI